MSGTNTVRAAALGRVCRQVVAAERHGEQMITIVELRLALEGVDVEGLAQPRPCAVANVGRSFGVSGVSSHTARA